MSDLVAQQDEETGVTPLMQAAERGDVGTVQVLLDAGAPWNQVDSRGLDAGSKAFKAGHQAVADVLVEAGVRAELLFRAMGARQREMGVASEADVSNRQYLDRQVRWVPSPPPPQSLYSPRATMVGTKGTTSCWMRAAVG